MHLSEVLGTYLYKNAFVKDAMEYACTIATVILMIPLILSAVHMGLFKTGRRLTTVTLKVSKLTKND